MLRGSARARLLSFVLTVLVLGTSGCRRRAPAPPRFMEEAEEVAVVLRRTSERLALMPSVAAYKWQHQLPVLDVAREQRLLERIAAQAQAELFTESDKAWLLPAESDLRRAVDAWLAPQLASGAVARTLSHAIEAASR